MNSLRTMLMVFLRRRRGGLLGEGSDVTGSEIIHTNTTLHGSDKRLVLQQHRHHHQWWRSAGWILASGYRGSLKFKLYFLVWNTTLMLIHSLILCALNYVWFFYIFLNSWSKTIRRTRKNWHASPWHWVVLLWDCSQIIVRIDDVYL